MLFFPVTVYVSRIGYIILSLLLWLYLIWTLNPYVLLFHISMEAAHDSSIILMTSYSLCLGLVTFPTQPFAFVLFLMYIALLGNYYVDTLYSQGDSL